jgi:hypothetical protein
MYLRLTPNLLHFLPDLDALYPLGRAPNFYEIHPWSCENCGVGLGNCWNTKIQFLIEEYHFNLSNK